MQCANIAMSNALFKHSFNVVYTCFTQTAAAGVSCTHIQIKFIQVWVPSIVGSLVKGLHSLNNVCSCNHNFNVVRFVITGSKLYCCAWVVC